MIRAATPALTHVEKIAGLFRLLAQLSFRQCVVFCNHRSRAQKVAHALTDAGYAAAAIAGDMAQHERNIVM